MPYQQGRCLKVFLVLISFFLRLMTCHTAPREDWTCSKDGPRMRQGVNPLTGEDQSFYYDENHPTMKGWFKEMEQIIRERGLWPETGLLADCSGKCPPDRENCCCCTLLFNQPDFVSQKSELQELVEKQGHLCDFYPSITVRWTSLNNTGVLQNSAFILQGRVQPLRRSRSRYWIALMIFQLLKSASVFSLFLF